MIADVGMDSVLPTVLVYDEQQDRVLFVYNVIFNDPDRAKMDNKPCQQFVVYSDDAEASRSRLRSVSTAADSARTRRSRVCASMVMVS